MKKLFLSIALTALAALAVQADDSGAKATTEQHSCCKAKAAQQASASCCSKAKQTAVKKTATKQALLSPKAAAAL